MTSQVDKNTIFCWVAYKGLSAQVSSFTYLWTYHMLVTQYLWLIFLYTTYRVPALPWIACTCSHTSAMFPSIVRKQRTAGFSLFLLQWHRSGLHTSPGKESACNAGDSSSIPGLGRSPGERIGYPL